MLTLQHADLKERSPQTVWPHKVQQCPDFCSGGSVGSKARLTVLACMSPSSHKGRQGRRRPESSSFGAGLGGSGNALLGPHQRSRSGWVGNRGGAWGDGGAMQVKWGQDVAGNLACVPGGCSKQSNKKEIASKGAAKDCTWNGVPVRP